MYILFDIGGTKMRAAGTSDLERIENIQKRETPSAYSTGMDTLAEMITEISGGGNVEGIAGGLSGVFNNDHTQLLRAPNKDWVGKPIADDLKTRFDAPVFLENDAAVVGLGEAHYGVARGHAISSYITVSTGVGGARIVDGRIDSNAHGFEPGHQVIDVQDETPVLLEDIISGSALTERTGIHPSEIHDDAVWDTEARLLAYGLNNVAVLWSPEVIVLGGAMIFKRPGIHTEKVEEYFRKVIEIFPSVPALAQATLEDDGGLYGAMVLLQQKLDPVVKISI